MKSPPLPEPRAEDLLTLASEAPTPHGRRELLRRSGDALLAGGHWALAEEIFADLSRELDGAGPVEAAPVGRQRALLRKLRAAGPAPAPRFDRVAICSGHMIDAPDRKTPRFPARKVEAVRAEIARCLEAWGLGAGDLAICGGACGADTLFAEECLRRGARLRLLLAQEIDAFIRDSVESAGGEWVRRFHALCQQAEVATQPERLGPAPPGISIYARTNLWMIQSARVEARNAAKLHALLVWDQKPTGDGPGGTSDFEARVRGRGGAVEIVDPTSLP